MFLRQFPIAFIVKDNYKQTPGHLARSGNKTKCWKLLLIAEFQNPTIKGFTCSVYYKIMKWYYKAKDNVRFFKRESKTKGYSYGKFVKFNIDFYRGDITVNGVTLPDIKVRSNTLQMSRKSNFKNTKLQNSSYNKGVSNFNNEIKRNFSYVHSQQKINARKLVYRATSQTNLARENLWKAEQLKNKSFLDAVCKASKISERMIKRTMPQ